MSRRIQEWCRRWRGGAVLAVLCGLCAPAARVAAQEAPGPEAGGGFLNRAQRWVDDHPRAWAESLHRQGIYPRLSGFAPGTGAAPGLDYWHPSLGGTEVGFLGSVARSFRGDSLVQVRFGRFARPAKVLNPRTGYPSLEGLAPFPGPHSGEPPFFLYFEATGRDLLGGRVFGAEGQELRYESNDSAYDMVTGYVLAPSLAVTARVGLFESRVSGFSSATAAPAGLDRSLTGFGNEIEFTRYNLEVAWDTRDEARDPRSGSFVSAAWWRYDDRSFGGAYGFDRFELDARQFLPLGSDRHVLALRGWGSFSQAGDHGVPFHLQASLGGSRVLRGYPGFRFRGNDVLAGSAEYRFELHPKLELAAFYDVGHVAGGLAEERPTGFLSSWGGGIRLKNDHGVLLRLDVARGREGTQAHLQFGYSF